MGTPLSRPQKGGEPPSKKKLAYVYCGQAAGWMKLVLGLEIGLSPGDFVLDGDPPRAGSGAVSKWVICACDSLVDFGAV